MSLSLYEITYLITHLFDLYIIKKYLDVFFCLKKQVIVYSILGYMSYFLITSFAYLLFDIPVINALLNVVLLFFITMFYDAGIKKRIWSVFFIYATFALVEIAVTVITLRPVFSWFEHLGYADTIGITINKILQFLVVLLIQNIVHIRSKGEVPVLYLIASIFVPILSIAAMMGITSIENITPWNVIICITFLVFINAIVFLLYDSFSVLYGKQIQTAIAEQERKYYFHQCQIMQESAENLRDFRHDINNHIMVLNELIQKEQYIEAQKYIDLYTKQIKNLKTICSETGNIAIDSILNYKLGGVSQKKWSIHVKANVPTELPIEITDLSAILTNLLDNAMQALSETENGSLFVEIQYAKSILFITIKNSFNGRLNYENGELQSSKKESGHGRGLKIIEKISEKYDGVLSVTHDDEFFTTKVMLYAEKS